MAAWSKQKQKKGATTLLKTPNREKLPTGRQPDTPASSSSGGAEGQGAGRLISSPSRHKTHMKRSAVTVV